jgi:hypothetical protein
MSAREWPEPPGEALVPMRPRAGKIRASGRAHGRQRPPDIEGEAPRPPAPPAEFATAQPVVVDTEKWPIVPVIWWQPDLRVTLPESSGLRNERLHKVPVAGFLDTAEQLGPDLPLELPSGDLVPLGWDRLALPRDGNTNGRGAVNGHVK